MKAAEARKRLLEESVRLIAEQGLDALSLREMARRAGVSHQAPYHHFKSREGMLAAIVLEGFTRLDGHLRAALEGRARRPPREVLRDVIAAYVACALENPVHFRVMFRPDVVRLRDYPDAYVQAMLTFQRLVDAVADCHPGADRAAPRFVEVVSSLWAGAHGVATLLLDGPMALTSPGMALPAFVHTATDLFAQAGANADLGGEGAQNSSDRFSDGSTTSSSRT